ncbi:MAG: GNAT family N-acetyltransferase [Vulcanimicrobiaceae bacterium]
MESAESDVSIERVPAATDDVRALVAELDRTLAAAYDAEQRHGLSIDELFRPNVRFFIARSPSAALGCAGIALLGTYAEVKRMYVREEARGRGVARRLLAMLEREARACDRTEVRLETGSRQLAAIRFYEAAGYAPRAAFGAYAEMRPSAIATSRFYAKQLA